MICNDVANIYQLLDEAKYNTTNFADVEGVAEAPSDIYISLQLYHPEVESSYCLCIPSN